MKHDISVLHRTCKDVIGGGSRGYNVQESRLQSVVRIGQQSTLVTVWKILLFWLNVSETKRIFY